jgi:hypothetical protein
LTTPTNGEGVIREWVLVIGAELRQMHDAAKDGAIEITARKALRDDDVLGVLVDLALVDEVPGQEGAAGDGEVGRVHDAKRVDALIERLALNLHPGYIDIQQRPCAIDEAAEETLLSTAR